MSEYEMMQWAAIAGGGLLVGGGAYALWRSSKQLDALWPDAAKKYGLTYENASQGNAFTNAADRDVLTGPGLEVVSMKERVGNLTRTSTVITAAASRMPPNVVIEISRRRPPTPLHLVKTNDPRFDAVRFVTSGQGDAVVPLLSPEVRAAVLLCPQSSLRVHGAEGRVVVSFGDRPLDEAALHGPIELAKALAEVAR